MGWAALEAWAGPLRLPIGLSRVQAWRPQAKPRCEQAWAWGPMVEVTKTGLGWTSLGLAALRTGLVCCIGTMFRHKPCNMSTRTSWEPFNNLCLVSWGLLGTSIAIWLCLEVWTHDLPGPSKGPGSESPSQVWVTASLGLGTPGPGP